MADVEGVKQRAEFTAWGMPVIYVVTAAVIFAAFVPHFKANSAYLKQHIAGYVGKLAIFAAVNILCSIFLFWSPAINFALVNFLLNFLMLCTISLPAFPTTYAKNFAIVFFAWMLIYCGVAPATFGGAAGVIGSVSVANCQSYYRDADVVLAICKDGWVTFTLFCSIITIGLTFLANLILISVAFDPALQSAATDAAASGPNPYDGNQQQQQQYQNPAVPAPGHSDGGYQSYQNAENNA